MGQVPFPEGFDILDKNIIVFIIIIGAGQCKGNMACVNPNGCFDSEKARHAAMRTFLFLK